MFRMRSVRLPLEFTSSITTTTSGGVAIEGRTGHRGIRIAHRSASSCDARVWTEGPAPAAAEPVAQGRMDFCRPHSVKAHPQEPIGGMKPEAARALPPQDDQLMSQGDKLEFQRRSAAKPERENGNESR